MKKKYNIVIAVILIAAILLCEIRILPVEKLKAAENEEVVLSIYESGNLIGTCTSIEEAFASMDNPLGDYKVIFNNNQIVFTLFGKIELPKVSNIELVGIFDISQGSAYSTTTIFVDDNIYLQSNLTLKDIQIRRIIGLYDNSFVLGDYNLTIQGSVGVFSDNQGIFFNIEGEKGSCIIVDNDASFSYYGNLVIDTVIIKNEGMFYAGGGISKIQTLLSSGEERNSHLNIFGSRTNKIYCSIESIKLYGKLNINIDAMCNLEIASIEKYIEYDMIHINISADQFPDDEDLHVNISGNSAVILHVYFYIDNFSQKDYQTFRDKSVL